MALTNIVTNIDLDVYDHDLTPTTVKAIALDGQTRYVAAALLWGRVPYDIGQGAGVTLTVMRPDKTGVQITGSTYSYDADGTAMYGAYAELTQLALAIKGTCKAQFKITSGEQILRTEIFGINNGQALDADVEEWAGDLDGHNLDEMAESIETLETNVGQIQEDLSTVKEGLSAIEYGNDLVAVEWEQGSIDNSGANVSSNTTIRTTDYIDLSADYVRRIITDASMSVGWFWYDANKSYLSKGSATINGTYNLTVYATASYVRFTAVNLDPQKVRIAKDAQTVILEKKVTATADAHNQLHDRQTGVSRGHVPFDLSLTGNEIHLSQYYASEQASGTLTEVVSGLNIGEVTYDKWMHFDILVKERYEENQHPFMDVRINGQSVYQSRKPNCANDVKGTSAQYGEYKNNFDLISYSERYVDNFKVTY